jgi:hypothetical protein
MNAGAPAAIARMGIQHPGSLGVFDAATVATTRKYKRALPNVDASREFRVAWKQPSHSPRHTRPQDSWEHVELVRGCANLVTA